MQFIQTHGKTLPITFLIFIPSIIAICWYIYGYYYFPTLSSSDHNFSSNHTAFITLVSALGCYVIIIIYGVYPITFTSEKYKKRYHDIASEFEFIKKVLFVSIPILIILTTVDQLFTYFQISSYLISYYLPYYDLSFAILASSMAVVIGALLRVSTRIIKKEFRFYLAKGYCIVALKKEQKEDDLDRIKYLFFALDSYNKYLLRKIKFGIKNINKIYSDIIINSDSKKKDEIIKSIYEYLGGEDRLKLATYLSTLYRIPDTEQFFVKESLVQKLRTIGAFLIAAIPIVISIIQLVSKRG
ncbi:MAG TPA: hypothetical protein VFI70_11365 [Nitrososphaeraceae archaeon]|nr:hypothetical protein [Nitrososphaeraceae archaeon]